MPEGAIRSRASEPLERQVELLKTTAFVATALVPFAAKVSVVPCCSVRFGTAEREQAELTFIIRLIVFIIFSIIFIILLLNLSFFLASLSSFLPSLSSFIPSLSSSLLSL